MGVKIAIIDSGIDVRHAAFQGSSLTIPDGYPKTGTDSDADYTNNKVIAARSYVSLLPNPLDPDWSVRDRVGHGTAVAMSAAGLSNSGPEASITGVAPGAHLGNYKVFGTPGFNDSSTTAAILKAIDDAVEDGMDVINLSLGSDLAPRLEDDPEVKAIESATRAGVIVVAAAGNNGPGLNRIASPATAPSAISVGASYNDRTFSSSVEATGLSPISGVATEASAKTEAISAALADVSPLDGTGQACSTLPSGSLTGTIALVFRGECSFETKLNTVRSAGAVAAVVYSTADSPEPITMAVDSTLPAQMVSYADGLTLKQTISAQESVACTMRFARGAVSVDSDRIARFSANGPSVDASIKPDLVAVGKSVYTATQHLDRNGSMYSEDGYTLVDGTSFSSPIVAGAAALLKSARPGLTVEQYRSLLVNTAAPIEAAPGSSATAQQAGAGLLDVGAALRGTVAADPSAVNLGSGGPSPEVNRTLTITNVGSSAETFAIAVAPRNEDVAPVAASNTIQLAAGASAEVPLEWRATGLAEGAHEGVIRVVAVSSGIEARIPYWYAVTSDRPAEVSVLSAVAEGLRLSVLRDAIQFRVLDAAGLTLTSSQPKVSSISGNGIVLAVVSYDDEVPGLYSVTVQLSASAGANVFRIQAGDAVADVTIGAR
jgi:subtilisin family serine protease